MTNLAYTIEERGELNPRYLCNEDGCEFATVSLARIQAHAAEAHAPGTPLATSEPEVSEVLRVLEGRSVDVIRRIDVQDSLQALAALELEEMRGRGRPDVRRAIDERRDLLAETLRVQTFASLGALETWEYVTGIEDEARRRELALAFGRPGEDLRGLIVVIDQERTANERGAGEPEAVGTTGGTAKDAMEAIAAAVTAEALAEIRAAEEARTKPRTTVLAAIAARAAEIASAQGSATASGR